MIKKLSLKFVLVFLVLVVSVIITSSCYAFSTTVFSDISNSPYTLDEVNQILIDNGYGDYVNYKKIFISSKYGSSVHTFWVYIPLSSDVSYLREHQTYQHDIYFKDSEDNSVNISYLRLKMNAKSNTFGEIKLMEGYYNFSMTTSGYTNYVYYSNFDCYNQSGTLVYNADVVAPDTSFDYSFEGVSKDNIRLSISNLDSDLIFYATFNDTHQYLVGDVLSPDSLKISKVHSDIKGLYYILNPGDYINYYICDSTNEVLSIGTIDELCNGYFLYGYETGNFVNFIFLKDGFRYWSEDLNFYYSSDNKIYINYDSIMTHSSYIDKELNLASVSLYAKVVDSNNNILADSTCTYYNDLYEVNFDYISSYLEYGALASFGKPVSGKAGIVKFSRFYLLGYNSDGSVIDFSNYYIKWYISSNANILGIKNGENLIVNRSGIINSTSNGVIPYYLEFHFDESSYIPFNINFDVYDNNNNLVSSNVVNSDIVIKEQIDFDSDKVNNDNFAVESNPNYTGGSSSLDINNIQNWKADDFANLMSTDNFVWEFFKSILGNLPWWITTPLFILLFGVVIITLARFLRGA